MIICKPNQTAVFALGGFLVLCYTFLLLAFYYNIIANQPSLVSFIVIVVAFTLLLFFTVKLLVGYITITVDENKIRITYPAIGKKYHFTLQQLVDTEEVRIKTFPNKEYRQYTLYFQGTKVTINNQVYTNYDKLKNYFNQKKSRKKKK